MPEPVARTLAQLQALRLAAERSLERAVSDFERGLQDALRALETRLRGILPSVQDDNLPAIRRAARLGALRTHVRAQLKDVGYDALIADATGDVLDALGQRVAAIPLGKEAQAWYAASRPDLDAFVRLMQSDLLGQGDEIARQIWRAVVMGTVGGQTRKEAVEALAEQIGISVPQTRTLYDTYAQIYMRETEVAATDDDPNQLFIYLGPQDLVTRPFCAKWVGKVLRRPDIEALDNGQLPNPLLTGGGYNCRHQWTAISEASELAPLAGTGQRAPEWEAMN